MHRGRNGPEVRSRDMHLAGSRGCSCESRRAASRSRAGSVGLLALLAVAITGCGTDSSSTSTIADPSAAPPGVSTSQSTPPSSSAVTTASPSATTLTTLDDGLIETREIGRSVEDRPIIGERRGTPGGRVVLIVGVIHGSEGAGMSIMDRLHGLDVPAGVDLWLVDSMNPDGYAANTRQNAKQGRPQPELSLPVGSHRCPR
jgi:hypothetical protein